MHASGRALLVADFAFAESGLVSPALTGPSYQERFRSDEMDANWLQLRIEMQRLRRFRLFNRRGSVAERAFREASQRIQNVTAFAETMEQSLGEILDAARDPRNIKRRLRGDQQRIEITSPSGRSMNFLFRQLHTDSTVFRAPTFDEINATLLPFQEHVRARLREAAQMRQEWDALRAQMGAPVHEGAATTP